MNRKGYTLLEILIVIAIIATIGLFATINLDKIMGNSKQDRYDIMIQDIKLSANTFITIYEQDESFNPYNGNRWSSEIFKLNLGNNNNICISIKTLQNALLLDETLKDPRNNKIIDGDNTYVVVKNDGKEITFSLGDGDKDTMCYSDNPNSCNNAKTSCGRPAAY